ncbi:hypothetical protein ACFPQA_08840 [Marinobacter koreensis]|uniref:Transposase n=1 Tax=Marinobacter koreensis TaxID=335974 RepID=A0ABW0RNP3_9GAMM|nr:hypothetical protein [Marinobacter koreensis]MCK7547542.1 hypothetical protein [Marinobacter koreensis]
MAFILARTRAAYRTLSPKHNEEGSPADTQAATGLKKPRLVAQPGLF